MKIRIDLDNTLLDFDQGWVDLHNEMRDLYGYRRHLPPARARTPQFYGELHLLSGHDSIDEFWRWFNRNGGWWRIPPMEGAVQAVRRLAGLGHEVTFVTARPHSAVTATRLGLAGLFGAEIPWTLAFATDKVRLVRDPKGEAWIEDHPGTLEALDRVGVSRLYKISWPWNTAAPGQATTWAEVARWENL